MTPSTALRLNDFIVIDPYRIAAVSRKSNLFYVLCAHTAISTSIPMEFTCKLQVSATCRQDVFVETSTIPTDCRPSPRSIATGRILDEALYNIDWRFAQGECEELKRLLSTRQFTNSSVLIGDFVNARLTPGQASATVNRILERATAAIDAQPGPNLAGNDSAETLELLGHHLRQYFSPASLARAETYPQ